MFFYSSLKFTAVALLNVVCSYYDNILLDTFSDLLNVVNPALSRFQICSQCPKSRSVTLCFSLVQEVLLVHKLFQLVCRVLGS